MKKPIRLPSSTVLPITTMKSKKKFTGATMRFTPIRRNMVSLFMNNPGIGFSEAEINECMNSRFDRTTVYRSIRLLLKEVFIHKIVCENGVLKYALTPAEPIEPAHAHFQCSRCKKVSCLTQTPVKPVGLPTGFQAIQINLLIHGICPQCTLESINKNY